MQQIINHFNKEYNTKFEKLAEGVYFAKQRRLYI